MYCVRLCRYIFAISPVFFSLSHHVALSTLAYLMHTEPHKIQKAKANETKYTQIKLNLVKLEKREAREDAKRRVQHNRTNMGRERTFEMTVFTLNYGFCQEQKAAQQQNTYDGSIEST